jgi:hypothetical protein
MRSFLRSCMVLSLWIGLFGQTSAGGLNTSKNVDQAAPNLITILNIYDQCCSGSWLSGSPGAKEERLPCPGSDADDRGFVRPLSANFALENSQSAAGSIETHPKWVPNGYILGAFSLNSLGIKLEQGDSFKAKIGTTRIWWTSILI